MLLHNLHRIVVLMRSGCFLITWGMYVLSLRFWVVSSMSNSHSAVACILVSSGYVDFNPFPVCISSLHWLFIHKQCVVVPLSTIASVAPDVLIGVCILDWINLLLCTIWLQYSPPLHIFLGLLYAHHLNGLSRVASALWLFSLFVHVPLLCTGSTQYPCD